MGVQWVVEMPSITLQFTVGFISLVSFHLHSNDSGEQMSMCFLNFTNREAEASDTCTY